MVVGTPVILALRLRQEENLELEASLSYIDPIIREN
jgi:hypothetical protein